MARQGSRPMSLLWAGDVFVRVHVPVDQARYFGTGCSGEGGFDIGRVGEASSEERS